MRGLHSGLSTATARAARPGLALNFMSAPRPGQSSESVRECGSTAWKGWEQSSSLLVGLGAGAALGCAAAHRYNELIRNINFISKNLLIIITTTLPPRPLSNLTKGVSVVLKMRELLSVSSSTR